MANQNPFPVGRVSRTGEVLRPFGAPGSVKNRRLLDPTNPNAGMGSIGVTRTLGPDGRWNWRTGVPRAGQLVPKPGQELQAFSQPEGERFVGREIERNPRLAEAVGGLYDNSKKATQFQMKSFDDFMGEFRRLKPKMSQQLDKDMEAFDTTGLEEELRANQSNREGQFRDVLGRLEDSDALYEEAQRGNLDAMRELIERFSSETAPKIQARTEDRALNEVARRYGLPNAGRRSSDLDTIIASKVADIGLGLEERKYEDMSKFMQNVVMPTEREFANRDNARMTGFEYPGMQGLTDRNENMLMQLQNLQMQVAGRSREEADAYLRSLNLPNEIREALIDNDIERLGAIAGIDEKAYYRGLEDTQGQEVSEPLNVAFSYPSLPTPRARTPEYRVPAQQDVQSASSGGMEGGPMQDLWDESRWGKLSPEAMKSLMYLRARQPAAGNPALSRFAYRRRPQFEGSGAYIVGDQTNIR